MRYLYTLVTLAITLCITPYANSQCLSYWLTSQEQVDNFIADTECTVLEGDLTLGGPDITSLAPLAGLSQVGNLIISNTSLTDLSGLEGLTVITGPLQLYQNNSLVSLNGLQNLGAVESIDIRECENLADITQLGNITSTPGDGASDGNVVIRDCYALTSLEGLHNISSVNSYCWIEHNSALTDLQGLRSLKYCGQDHVDQ